MKYKNEKQILNIVKYVPSLFVIFLSLCSLLFLFIENENTFQKEKEKIEKEYIKKNKELVKNQVLTIKSFIQKEQLSTEKELKESLKQRVYESHKIMTNIYNENKSKDKKIVTKMIKDALRTIRFNENRGYLFINSLDGFNIMHGLEPSIEGVQISKFKTTDGRYIGQEFSDRLKTKEELFDTWYWKKIKNNRQEFKKIGFVKKFKPYNWYIGTAEYVDEFEDMMKKNVLEKIKNFKYENDGYIFIFNQDSTYLSHARESSIGKKMIEGRGTINEKGEVNAFEVFNNFRLLAKSKGGYASYIQASKPTTKQPTHKIAYVDCIDNWHWIIGKGFYEDDVQNVLDAKRENLNEQFKESLEKILWATLIITVLLVTASLYFSRILERKFKKYKQEIEVYLDENTKQQSMLAQQAKMASMGEMIGNIAHQWRQPLSVISTAATGLKLGKEMNTISDKTLFETLDSINDSVQHLSSTIDDFRDYFTPDKEVNRFNTQSIINRTMNLLSAQFVTEEIKVVQHIQNIEMNTYERELLQVLINILNNAKDALINLSHEKYIFIDCYKEGSSVIIRIKDNAGGVEPEIMNKIFEPYFTTKHKSQGTGIGLYMSKEIIEKHMQAVLEVKNEKFIYNDKRYVGAVFTICFNCNETIEDKETE